MAASDIQKIYLGLLGRPADAEGLAYWNEQIEDGTLTLEQLRANIVNEQPEFADGPGQMSRADFVAQLYLKMFGREQDAEADYWINGEGAGVNLDQLVMAFTDGASEDDTVALNNRATVAQQVTDAGLALEDDASTLLEGVTNDPATVTAAQQAVEARASGEEESTGGGGTTVPTLTVVEAGTATGSYHLEDTAGSLNGATSDVLNGATDIAATGTADVAQATAIEAATNSGTTEIAALEDTAAAVAGSSDAVLDLVTGTVTSTGNATVAQSETLAGFTKAVVYNVEGTATEVADALGGTAEAQAGINDAVDVSATGTADVAQATAIEAATNSGTTEIAALEDTA
ncbi:DUF4214 domain-containing protein, partial [Vreelandella gomseomensis]